MRKHRNDNIFSSKGQRKNSKRNVIHNFLILFCCLALAVLVIGLMTTDFHFVENSQLKPHIFFNTVPSANISTNLIPHAQGAADETSWCLILINKWNPISSYEVALIELPNGQAIDKRINPALQEMFADARSDDIYPVVVSGYRTVEEQQSLMDEKIAAFKAEGYSAEEATIKSEAWVAVPGTSEHQLGIAVDIGAGWIPSSNEDVYEWLHQNSYRFGFIRRYSAAKMEITGIIDEPWHYRYVGIEAATAMYNQDICLEEYLEQTRERGN